ncbi:MAG: hypothetical protein OWV35_00980 [Firmicutes bacterium]|nr:hypothetical protein [Bacillota bacterium]
MTQESSGNHPAIPTRPPARRILEGNPGLEAYYQQLAAMPVGSELRFRTITAALVHPAPSPEIEMGVRSLTVTTYKLERLHDGGTDIDALDWLLTVTIMHLHAESLTRSHEVNYYPCNTHKAAVSTFGLPRLPEGIPDPFPGA